MIYRVLLVEDADAILDGLEETRAGLVDFPERGNKPKELDALGIAIYGEIHFKPYRIIYRIIGRDIVIHGVFDGRRDMENLLQRRMLR